MNRQTKYNTQVEVQEAFISNNKVIIRCIDLEATVELEHEVQHTIVYTLKTLKYLKNVITAKYPGKHFDNWGQALASLTCLTFYTNSYNQLATNI